MERQHDVGTPEDTDPMRIGLNGTGTTAPAQRPGHNGTGHNGTGHNGTGHNGTGHNDAERRGNGVRGTDREEAEIDRVLPAMRGLRSRARVTNLSRATQLERAVDSAADGRLDETGRAQAAAVAHQLIGSAGTFGFADASRRAAELKDFFALADRGTDDVALARVRLSAVRADLQSGEDDTEF